MLSIIASETCNVNQNLKGILAMNVARFACNIDRMSIAQRIIQEREKKGWNQSQLARALSDAGQKVTPQSVQQWEKGETEPRSKKLQLMAQLFNVDPYWLQYGTGKAEAELPAAPIDTSNVSPSEAQKIVSELIFVPRYNVTASMGPGAVVDSEQVVDYLSFKRSWIEREHFNPDNLALINSRGDSMSPTINAGDLLLIDHSPIERLANGIYVINIDGDLLAKRVERQLDGSIRIISDNPKYPPQVISDEDAKKLTVVGKVVWAGGRM